MRLSQRTRLVIRFVVAALWLLGIMAIMSARTMQLLYVLPLLALLSYFLVDYLSSFIIATLLTAIVNSIFVDQAPGATRALIVDAIWITAVVAAAIKLLKPFDKPPLLSDKPHDQSGKLPPNFQHNMQTPISSILGFCNAILRADHEHGQAIPPLFRENIQSIYRNAQQLEKMHRDFFNQVKAARFPAVETFDPTALIQETVVMIQDLMAAHGIRLAVKIDNPLPQLALHRAYVRQVLLNVLRTFAHVNSSQAVETLVTVHTKVQAEALNITFTALNTRIRDVVTDKQWGQSERLLDMVRGRIWVEAIDDPDLNASYTNVVLELPIPVNSGNLASPPSVMPGTKSHADHRNILVVSEESHIIDFFKEQLTQYEVTGIKDIRALYQSPAEARPAAVILTREQHASHLQTICAAVGKHTPIMLCPIPTAQELLQQLNCVYLPKPIDYGALLGFLTNANLPVTDILIVDDNIDSAEMLAQMVTSMSPTFVSRKAYLALDALTLLDEHNIGAIILDVSLPDMDGITLVQQIRANERLKQIPIMIVSARKSLDAMLPIIISRKISLFQLDGFEPDKLLHFVEALVKSR